MTVATTQQKTIKILVIDDETKLINLIKANFQDEIDSGQYEFDWCSNGEDALKQIRKTRFDLLFVDITMPIMSGFELISKLHQLNFNIPSIIITGNEIEAQYYIQAMKLRSYDLIPKPIKFARLKESIVTTLKLHEYYSKQEQRQVQEQAFFSDSEFSPHSLTLYKEMKSLTPEQQVKIVLKVIENEFNSEQIEELQSELPALLEIAREDDEYKQALVDEDVKRIEQGKIPLVVLEKSYIELKNDSYTKKKTGEKVIYNYILLRWLEDDRKQNFRQIKKQDWQDEQVRQKVIGKLKKRDWSEDEKYQLLNAISKLEKKKIEQVVEQKDLRFLATKSLLSATNSSPKTTNSKTNTRSRKTFKLY